MELYFYKVVKETLKKLLFHGCLNGVKRVRIYLILKKHGAAYVTLRYVTLRYVASEYIGS